MTANLDAPLPFRGVRAPRPQRLSPMPDPKAPDDDSPGLPGFRTWRGVYLFVIGCFAAVVILLTVFSRWFA